MHDALRVEKRVSLRVRNFTSWTINCSCETAAIVSMKEITNNNEYTNMGMSISGQFQLGHLEVLATLELTAAGSRRRIACVGTGVIVLVCGAVMDSGLAVRALEVGPAIQRVSIKTVTFCAWERARRWCRRLLCGGPWLSGSLRGGDRTRGCDRGFGSNRVAVHILWQVADFGIFVEVQAGRTALAEGFTVVALVEARAALGIRKPTQTRNVSAPRNKNTSSNASLLSLQ